MLFINKTANLVNRLLSSTFTFVLLFISLFITSNIVHDAFAADVFSVDTKPLASDERLPEHLSDKFYRQALYYYFQQKPNIALQQLDINDYYFSDLPTHNTLFKAGLQISQGLPEHAQQLLVEVSNKLTQGENQASSDHQLIESHLKKEELMIIVLLQLAEQKIAQQYLTEAQTLLNNIKEVPQQHLPQYFLLQQLVTWPQAPKVEQLPLSAKSKKQLINVLNSQTQAPYVILNDAIRAVQQQEYLLAEQKFTQLSSLPNSEKTRSFWQTLFTNTNNDNGTENTAESPNNSGSSDNSYYIEQTGIKNYAQLLLAQSYIEQGLYLRAYNQLNSFPKNTAFSEQALFLFAYSAVKLRKFNVSEVILDNLLKNYPYSTFTQQALLLSVKQYIEQNKLNKALDQLLFVEQFFKDKQQSLSFYKQTISTENNLVKFYQHNNNQGSSLGLWLTASLNDVAINQTYQQLLTVNSLSEQLSEQTAKNTWLENTIKLNNLRQQKVKGNYKASYYQNTLTLLNDKKDKLKSLLNNAKSINTSDKQFLGNSELFANKSERNLLTRLENSEKSLAFIEQHSDKNTQDYTQRLKRVNGVLTWQLQQQFSERYWQSAQQLNEVEKLITKAEKQYEQTNAIVLQQGVLTNLQNKQQNIAKSIDSTVTKTQQLHSKLNAQLLNENYRFIGKEKNKIEQFLLLNQHSMASVIESLNKREAL